MKTVVVIQARYDSTRLPGKALKLVGGIPLLAWTMRALKQVHADTYVLATDADGYQRFLPLATQCGYLCMQGPKEDVLDRFCMVIRATGADVVLRATGDNPYLFYEAASWSLDHFSEYGCDYFTLSGLPHGSGIEVFSASALLQSAFCTEDPYDHEHVGPALYRHTDRFSCAFVPSPTEWNYPNLRTTIDTASDYDLACGRTLFLSDTGAQYGADSGDIAHFMECMPPSYSDIIAASSPVLLVPCVKKGCGTGHLRRCIQLLDEIPSSFLFCDPHELSVACRPILDSVPAQRRISVLPAKKTCRLVVLDGFRTSARCMAQYRQLGPVLALDEGGAGRNNADFLLDIIPGCSNVLPNMQTPEFMPLPIERRSQQKSFTRPKTILVSFGGEDPARLSLRAATALSVLFPNAIITVTGTLSNSSVVHNIRFCETIPNLKEKLVEYDLVVTHYGFTAYEATAAGCRVLLLATTKYHGRLSALYGFPCITSVPTAPTAAVRAFSEALALPYVPTVIPGEQRNLANFITSCMQTVGVKYRCPVCASHEGTVIARVQNGTFRRCKSCSMIYRETFAGDISAYDKSYFFDDYKRQYGKTYLEDFESIKEQGMRRCQIIQQVLKSKQCKKTLSVLDVGCAYGPFLVAARDSGFLPFGVDIPKDAVSYVTDTLCIPAVCGAFPASASEAAKMVTGEHYDVVTMWWVIEHFADLHAALTSVSQLLKKGGIFAFSTPSAAGVSATYSFESFYRNSPADHYTVWNPATTARILHLFGFKIVNMISTGHHPERFPFSGNSEQLLRLSKKKKLGDSFEVYAVKCSE